MTTTHHPRRRTGLSDEPDWYRDAVIYELRVRSYYDKNGDGIGDLEGATEKLDYLHDLGVDAVWLLPLCRSPGRDDGYDISDYRAIQPEAGTLADFEHFLHEAHRRGIRVITELVLNHTSDQHPWFQRARHAPAGSPERDYYVWSDKPDRYSEARIIFKDFELSNWAWDPVAHAYFWHRFYSHQPDLNFDNPHVHEALLGVVDFWLGLGVDGVRLDAVPYLYERDGTNCENLPETHAFLRKLRKHVDARYRNRMLLAEANQWPVDAAEYFGEGDECHMNFHFPIMPRMFMAIRMEDRLPIVDILAQTPPAPSGCQWALFLRNHDELTLEMVTDDERDYMIRAYARDPAMRINLGIRRRLAPLVGNDRRQMELLNGLLFSLPGTPVIYYGDEIGMGDNVYLGDRNGVRTPMQWSADRNGGFSRANPQKLVLPVILDPEYHFEWVNVEAQQNNSNSFLWWMKRLVALRKRLPALGRGSLEVLQPDNHKVLAFVRRHGDERVLVVANLSRAVQCAELDLTAFHGMALVELTGRTPFPSIGSAPYLITLPGHAFYWFSLERPELEFEERTPAHAPGVMEVDGAWTLVFDALHRKALEFNLGVYVSSRHWFESRPTESRRRDALLGASVVDVFHLPNHETVLALVQLNFSDGESELLQLPLTYAEGERAADYRARSPESVVVVVHPVEGSGARPGILVDASVSVEALTAFAELVFASGHLVGAHGELFGVKTRALDALWSDEEATLPSTAAPEARVLRANANAVLCLRDRVVLKIIRHVDPGTSTRFELGRFLAEGPGASLCPPLAGSIEYRPHRGEPLVLAVLEGYVAHEGTARDHAVAELARFYDRILTTGRAEAPAALPEASSIRLGFSEIPDESRSLLGPFFESATLLGRRTAELHLALASSREEALAPEPLSTFDQRSIYQSIRNAVGRVFRRLRAELPRLSMEDRRHARDLLAREGELLSRSEVLVLRRLEGRKIRVHGDLRLDHVIFTGTDFVVVDLDGGRGRELVQRRRKRSALADVASMLRSLRAAAHTALFDESIVRMSDRERLVAWASLWQTWAVASYVRGYLDRAQGPREEGRYARTDWWLLVLRDRSVQAEGQIDSTLDANATAALLEALVIEQALDELGEELDCKRGRPGIPLAGILDVLGAQRAEG